MAAYCSSCFGPAMPTLRHLALLDILIKQRAHWLEVSDRLLDVAPQLRSLAIHAVSSTPRSSSGATALLDLMPYLISLRYLDITLQPTVSILSLLLLLPSKLWSLRLGYPTPLANIKSIPDIHEALDYWPDSLKELKRLLLPSLVSSLGQICGEGRPIVAICARRNVSLVYIEARGKGIEDWEERIGDFKEEVSPRSPNCPTSAELFSPLRPTASIDTSALSGTNYLSPSLSCILTIVLQLDGKE